MKKCNLIFIKSHCYGQSIQFYNTILVLAQSETAENDEVSLKSIEDLQADIVKTSNEATLMFAGLENQLTELQVKSIRIV